MSCHYLLESASEDTTNRGGDLQSKWPTAGLLHDLVDVLRLEVVLEERIVEALPLDLGKLYPVALLLQLPLTLGSVIVGESLDRCRFRRDILCACLLEEDWGSRLRDGGGAAGQSRSMVRGWSVASDGCDALSGEPHLGRSGTVHHLLGVRIDELGVEDASRGKCQLPHESVIRDESHLAKIREE